MELVDDLADLQAIERPDFNPVMEDIDLADIARRAAGLLAVKASDHQIRIEAPNADETLPAVGEFRRALQIMVNLIGNAIRYSPEHYTIWISVEGEGDLDKGKVAAQGRGSAPQDPDKIFDNFERLGRDEAGGSGCGRYLNLEERRVVQVWVRTCRYRRSQHD